MERDLGVQLVLLQASAALILGALYLKKRRRRRERRWWVHPLNARREEQGDFTNLIREMREDPYQFFMYMRMTPELFDSLLELVSPFLQKKSIRKSLPVAMRLAITLRFLATGDSIPSLAWNYRIGKSTCCKILNETTCAIWNALHEKYLSVPTEEDYTRIAKEFSKIWNLPNCIGAIDGKHVIIQSPANSGSQFFNYKKNFSIVLMAVCDANYCFTHVDIGSYGSQSDSGIFTQSEFGQKFNNNLLPVPPPAPFPNTTDVMPHYFVGDAAFPLKNNLMKPFSKASLTNVRNKIYNYRLSRARRVIENTFGIMVSRWRIFHRVINAKPENVDNIIKAAVCLHNFLQNSENNCRNKTYCPLTFVDREVDGQLVEGNWRRDVPQDGGAFQELNIRIGARNATQHATQVRERLADYLISPAGNLEGQLNYVLRGNQD